MKNYNIYILLSLLVATFTPKAFSEKHHIETAEFSSVYTTYDGVLIRRPYYDPSEFSAAKRVGKKFTVLGEVGFSIAPDPTAGIAAGYYVDSDLIAEVSYVSGSLMVEDVDLKWEFLEARARWFFQNSHYLNFALSSRLFTFGSSLADDTETMQIPVDEQMHSYGASLGWGNRWQFDLWTLGCDWVSYFVPLKVSGDSRRSIDGSNSDDLKSYNDVISKSGETAHFDILRMHVGVSF